MHVGHTSIFQNPNQSVSDYQIYQEDMAIAKEAADLGFQSVWAIEHHFTDYIMNPNVTQFLSFMAGYHPAVKVGSMVVVMPWYPAIRIAENMAMLDAMSDGRAIFGFGRGLSRIEFEGLQLDMGESTERMVETAEAVLNGLEQGFVEYDGKLIKQPRARIRPEPFKSFKNRTFAPSISATSAPIMARLGVGVLIIPQKPWDEHVADLNTYNAIYRQTHGGTPPRPIITSYTTCDKDAGRAEELARKHIVQYWREVVKHYELFSDHFKQTKGYTHYENVADALRTDHDALSDFFMDLQIWGTPEQCYDKVKAIHDRTNCCGTVHAFKYGGMPLADAQAGLRLFAREVMPELRKLGADAPFDVEAPRAPAFLAAE